MSDEELLEQAAGLPTAYFDGFGAYRKINGVMRCVGYIIGEGPQLNIILSLLGAEMANVANRRALQQEPMHSVEIWKGARAH